MQIKESPVSLTLLTERQREVLDLLLQHKTSKEIARDLKISPHTVDQRIRFAKEKLGVERRSDLATSYRRLRGVYEKTVYEESRMPISAIPLQNNGGPSENPELICSHPKSETVAELAAQNVGVRLVPAIFEGPSAVLMRIGAVFAIAASVIVIGIGGIAMLDMLSRIIG